MTVKERLAWVQQWTASTAARLGWFAPLLVRVTLAIVFIQSGWGKLHHLDKVVAFFESLGIPAPQLQAPFVASLELVGGCLLLVGLVTRVIAIPLAVTMVVALITAKASQIKGIGDPAGMVEFLYLVMLLQLVVTGAGALSLDAVVTRAIASPAPPVPGPRAQKVGLGVAAFGGVVVGAFVLWVLFANHNPCDQFGPGEFTELVNRSHNEATADDARSTCEQIATWKKQGKDPVAELKKREPKEEEPASSDGADDDDSDDASDDAPAADAQTK